MNSSLYTGSLVHARREPRENVFRYGVCFYVLDLDELPELHRSLALFSYRHANALSFHERDHLGEAERPAKENVVTFLRGHGIDLDGGRVLLLTNLRVLGYVFNPVSFYWCYRSDGALACMIAEVRNTFGEMWPYLLTAHDRIEGAAPLAYRADKHLHVSPFFGLEQEYRFFFSEPDEHVFARVDVWEDGERRLGSMLSGARRPLTNANVARALARYPADDRAGHRAHPLAGAQALAEGRAVPPQAPVRAGTWLGGPVSATSRSGDRLRRVPEARRLGVTPVARRLVLRALEELRGGELELRFPDGSVRRFGDAGAGPPVAARIASDDLFRRIATRGSIGLGEGYVAGDWETDDLPGVLELLVRNAESASQRRPWSTLARARELRPHLTTSSGLRRARRDIHYHYDLGNDFFGLFLDDSMTYSCAVYEHDGQTLEDAQQAKLRRLCDKLSIGPDDHVLEIGCGWGSFAIHAARERGARVTGLTISRAQHDLARERVRAAGLADRIEIRLQDYRLIDGEFTRIVSIEMFEAIGERQFQTFFATCDRVLTPDGLAGLQVIAVPDQRFARYRTTRDWIQEYIFPGSLIPSLGAMTQAMTRSSRFLVHSLEDIGPNYAETLGEWRERFLGRLDQVRALGYDDRFVRIWEYYLASCEALFRSRSLRDLQIVLTRPFNDALPRFPADLPPLSR